MLSEAKHLGSGDVASHDAEILRLRLQNDTAGGPAPISNRVVKCPVACPGWPVQASPDCCVP
jgi:hypothetical protein